MATRPTPNPKKMAKRDPSRGDDPVTKGLRFLFSDKSNPNVTKKQGAKKTMPSRSPRKPRATARPAPAGPKKKSPGVVITPKPKAKKPKLDDFLLKGKRPPIAPGQKKLPSDSDVILKNYNKKK